MPELPEVESVRRGLSSLVVGKKIETIYVDWPRIIITDLDIREWQQQLLGEQIENIGRRGKYLIFEMTNGLLISHLRMEGKYQYFTANEIPKQKGKHTHCRFVFTDGSQLHYHDVRKFGRMEWINKADYMSYFIQKKLGPEPTRADFDCERFAEQLEQSKKMLKPLLLDQSLVAGLGNIYVDEVLYKSQLHPIMIANQLNEQDVLRLYDAIIQVMEAAVRAGGSSVRTYLNSLGEAGTYQEQLQVYGRQNEPCARCGHPIYKIQLKGRGTHFCPQCQKNSATTSVLK
ncbi:MULTISPECIES: DNA-formamidopyrimidine glycosylase [unclassified Facklamia]|uniref:DNA-formamidopyrimidine glycosylase n=1 Tax=Aerococcaceae TaxID=186827 RepID=UPI0013B75895|nr:MULTISPECIES: DNA-formamidopyrimidine glycosylase [unclassified Facklamia]NEW63959.1 DNA-formamidopyrimidine glycosylase [Facklamia sp. 252]NEW67430.1 DNA-formamidopyrimidine glycosylase [Facklamia sp. 253]QQD65304.1 DNA-formamidopyrimidine glycosylase [Aerococcaceae bacterium zg-252]